MSEYEEPPTGPYGLTMPAGGTMITVAVPASRPRYNPTATGGDAWGERLGPEPETDVVVSVRCAVCNSFLTETHYRRDHVMASIGLYEVPPCPLCDAQVALERLREGR